MNLPQIFRIDSPVFELELAPELQRSLEQLVKQYPKTEAAQAARDRLLTMSPPARKSK